MSYTRDFLLTFTFEDHWSDTVDDTLQVIKATIFKTPQEPWELVQSAWKTQLSGALECYNIQAEEDDDNPQDIIVPETKGCRQVRGP